jgi:Mrp family chromosome partitioning ATPase
MALTAVVMLALALALLAGRRLLLDVDEGGRIVTRRHSL